jgi:hypothetical protein
MRAVLAQEASVTDSRASEAQIGETIRLVASLPAPLRRNNYAPLFTAMFADWRARAPYARYLARVRTDLAAALDFATRQRERLARAHALFLQYHKTVQVNSFVEKRENEIVAYVRGSDGSTVCVSVCRCMTACLS